MFKFTDGWNWFFKAAIVWIVQFSIVAAVFVALVIVVLKLLGV